MSYSRDEQYIYTDGAIHRFKKMLFGQPRSFPYLVVEGFVKVGLSGSL